VPNRRGDVGLQSRASLALPASDGQIREPVVLGEKFLGAGESRHHESPVAIGLIVEVGMSGEHARRAASGDERRVERLVKRVEFPFAFGKAARIEPGVMPQSVQRGDDACLPLAPPFEMLKRGASHSMMGDPQALNVAVRVNGELRATGTTAGMLFSFEEILADASQDETIHAREFFGSGTVGNCCGLETGRFLKDGDVVELEVERIGILQNTVVPQFAL
jgi:Fumarylacetoacetate (FAA) hydrolase family